MTVLWVMLGGAAGAVLRYLTDRRVQRANDSVFPWGTLTVNVAGSGLLGVLAGWALSGGEPGAVQALVGTGLCGALTTFSTFGYETVRLVTEGARLYAVANVVVTVLAGFGAAGAGLVLGTALWG
ncbi:fluoride efflux transporter CrcB [Prauserella sp. PE36]|uniref:Fluoride-specific ion channel FluC n=1 Tax=Prauserella endophytica TaxID=1592324 RepID=A0ABY2S2J0_9PSEU|nr:MULTISPECIES: fluoride efflux transporter CrcB [Prauserella]PXY33647.1 chromosome condensation protein CrcB [Prauserella coralliicola]RBM11682.1 fluoride efflux transporter CrcB [Prauserella sp. PE36]TKG69661.1 fluoride efflux transporter CrcB [Prauserella endophytica]